jgi:hypothetical protein
MDHYQTRMGRSVCRFPQPDQDVGPPGQDACTIHADPLNRLFRFPQTGRVCHPHRDPQKGNGNFDMVAGRTRKIGDDGSFVTDYRVEKTGLSRIRWTGQDDLKALAQRLRRWPLEPFAELFR